MIWAALLILNLSPDREPASMFHRDFARRRCRTMKSTRCRPSEPGNFLPAPAPLAQPRRQSNQGRSRLHSASEALLSRRAFISKKDCGEFFAAVTRRGGTCARRHIMPLNAISGVVPAKPTGPAFGRPDDRLRASRDPYGVPYRFGRGGRGLLSHERRWLWVPAFAGTTHEDTMEPCMPD